MSINKHIKQLERRADYLAHRIAEARAKGRESTYDVSELAALNWAIRHLYHLVGSQKIPDVDKL